MSAKEKVTKIIEEFIAKLKDDPAALLENIETIAMTTTDSPCQKWSFRNKLITLANGTQDARGFRQWQEVSRYVTKGSKAFKILFPRFKKELDEDTGEKVQRLVGFGYTNVFARESTALDNGAPDTPMVITTRPTPALLSLAEAWEISVVYSKAAIQHWLGSYNDDAKEIILCTDSTKVYYHELSHAAHRRACGNDHPSRKKEAVREFIAEVSAMVLVKIYEGKDAEQTAAQYVRWYFGDLDLDSKDFLLAVETTGKVVGYILDEAEKLNEATIEAVA